MRDSNRFRAGWIYSKLNRSVSMYVDVSLKGERRVYRDLAGCGWVSTMYNHESMVDGSSTGSSSVTIEHHSQYEILCNM